MAKRTNSNLLRQDKIKPKILYGNADHRYLVESVTLFETQKSIALKKGFILFDWQIQFSTESVKIYVYFYNIMSNYTYNNYKVKKDFPIMLFKKQIKKAFRQYFINVNNKKSLFLDIRDIEDVLYNIENSEKNLQKSCHNSIYFHNTKNQINFIYKYTNKKILQSVNEEKQINLLSFERSISKNVKLERENKFVYIKLKKSKMCDFIILLSNINILAKYKQISFSIESSTNLFFRKSCQHSVLIEYIEQALIQFKDYSFYYDQIKLSFITLKAPHPKLIGTFIKYQIEKQVSEPIQLKAIESMFENMKNILLDKKIRKTEKIKQSSIKISFKGRLKGAARTKKQDFEIGVTSYQKINKTIKFDTMNYYTRYGSTSVKLWTTTI